VAICLLEFLAAGGHNFPVKILATDLSDAALDNPQARDMVRKARMLGSAKGGVIGLTMREGGRRAVERSARALSPEGSGEVVVLGHDVTELQQAQERMLQAERLAALGQMVAGLAHEGRNALQRSQACLERLGFRLQGQPEVLDLVRRAQRAQDDLHHLFEDVRQYAGPIRLEVQDCDLAEVWGAAWEEIGPRVKGEAELIEETGDTDLRCWASPFHLQQVFRNLLDNAVAAAGPGARVVVRCSEAELEGREAVRVAIRDNGPGFTGEQRPRALTRSSRPSCAAPGWGCRSVGGWWRPTAAASSSARPGRGGEVVITLPRAGPAASG
jgi:signal transduction histidine kinase